MNTTQLECFLAVAESLNFARAAEQLHITQPAVTHQINSLENELNTKLFRRTTRMVEMTEEGYRFMPDARDILKISRSARERLAKPPEDNVLEFAIGCPNSHVINMLTKPLRELVTEFPQVHPVLKMFPEKRLQGMLSEESLHVILDFSENISTKETGTFVPLAKVPIVCTTAATAGGHRSSMTSRDLQTGKMILCEPHHIPAPLCSISGSLVATRPQSDLFFCDNLSCALALVKAGIGFMLLPGPILCRDNDLCYTPVTDLAKLEFGVCYKSELSHPVLKPFLRILSQCFAQDAV